MANTLNLGDGNWGVKDSSLLGYAKDNTKFVPETFDVTRASGGTRVNKSGLIETPTEILSGDLVINGDFATDSDWTKGSGWTISGGKAIASNVSASCFQTSSFVSGKAYKVTYTISDYVSGDFKVQVGSSGFGQTRTSNGTFTEYIDYSGSNFLYIKGSSSFNGSIDNISVVEVNQDNLARIDYTDGADGVLLTEPQSTNLVTDSEDFSDNSWTKIRTLVTPNSVISPEGSVNASTLSVSGATGGEEFIRVSSLDSNEATCSFYVKKGNWRYITIRSVNNSVFDFDTETFTLTGTDETLSFDKLNDGWYRLKASSPTRSYCSIGFAATATTPSAGSGVDGTNVYIWGAQIEEQSYATSYIPTYGAIATRSGDLVTNGGSVTNFNSEEGVLFAEIAALSQDANFQLGLFGTANEQIRFEFQGGVIKAQLFNGAYQANMSSGAITLTDNHKIAFKYKENDFALWVDGVEVATDTSGNTLSVNELTKLNLTSSTGAAAVVEAKTSQIQVFNTALSDSELQILTTI